MTELIAKQATFFKRHPTPASEQAASDVIPFERGARFILKRIVPSGRHWHVTPQVVIDGIADGYIWAEHWGFAPVDSLSIDVASSRKAMAQFLRAAATHLESLGSAPLRDSDAQADLFYRYWRAYTSMGAYPYEGLFPAEAKPSQTSNTSRISRDGITLLHHFESCRLTAYLDSVGVATIGWGNTWYLDGTPVRMGDRITQSEADALFEDVLNLFVDGVLANVTQPLLQHQLDALAAFAYNVGIPQFITSSVRRYTNQGRFDRAADGFLRWNRGLFNGVFRPIAGLSRRRCAERTLFQGNDWRRFNGSPNWESLVAQEYAKAGLQWH